MLHGAQAQTGAILLQRQGEVAELRQRLGTEGAR